jgi:hypothetical protein
VFGGCDNGCEVAPIGIGDRQWVKFLNRNDVVSDQTIFGDSSRPSAGGHAASPPALSR